MIFNSNIYFILVISYIIHIYITITIVINKMSTAYTNINTYILVILYKTKRMLN